jgi:hypothetical protein
MWSNPVLGMALDFGDAAARIPPDHFRPIALCRTPTRSFDDFNQRRFAVRRIARKNFLVSCLDGVSRMAQSTLPKRRSRRSGSRM